jgi:dienelactone hydrolase
MFKRQIAPGAASTTDRPHQQIEPGHPTRRCAALLWIAAVLVACGGGGDDVPATASPAPACAEGSERREGVCVAFATRTVERLPTPWVEDGRAQTLELIVYRPLASASARLPAVIVHHGSTGDGSDPTQFRLSFDSQTLAREFTARGYLVFFPQRRGRGASDGLYDEGFRADRSGYSCVSAQALPGLLRAGEDAEIIATGIESRTDVDPARLLVAGFSRGGLLALLHAAQRPARYLGVVNFVGGWLGEGCIDAVSLNRGAFTAAAAAPRSLWIYAENDPFYSAAHSRANYEAFAAARGVGQWNLLRRPDPTASGHLIHAEAGLWGPLFDAFESSLAR